MIQTMFAKLVEIVSNLKYAPYKILLPSRLVGLGIGAAGLAVSKSISGESEIRKGLKSAFLAFGVVCIASVLASALNPVTLYNGNRFGATTLNREAVGQADTGYLPSGATQAYSVVAPAASSVAGVAVEGASPRAPNMPGISMVGGGPGATGNLTGQTNSPIVGGLYSAPKMPQPAMPLFGAPGKCNPLTGEGCGVVPPLTGSIYIREPGETPLIGG